MNESRDKCNYCNEETIAIAYLCKQHYRILTAAVIQSRLIQLSLAPLVDSSTKRDLARKLPDLHAEVMEKVRQGALRAGDATPLADIRDYFMFQVLRCGSREEALEIIERLHTYEAYMERIGDKFYTGFFFALSNLLHLRFEIATLPGEEISYEAFERSFTKTIEKLGMRGL